MLKAIDQRLAVLVDGVDRLELHNAVVVPRFVTGGRYFEGDLHLFQRSEERAERIATVTKLRLHRC